MSCSRSRLPVWLHTLLVAALMWAPLWGHQHNIGHGIEHASDRGTRLALLAPGELQAADAQDDHWHAGYSDALGHEADADLCRVLDHLSQAERLSAACSPGLAPTGTPEPPIFRFFYSSEQDRWSPAHARAPPVLI